ncbi:MAG TPA: transcriptional repressor [Nocardioidaceae bacterium]
MGLQETLRAKGYRITPQRQLILDAVTDLGHATPEEAFAWVTQRSSGVNISTVYRTLELLEELGLVKHAHLSHGAPTYHAATAPEHVHLICRTCGTITEVSPQTVEPLVDQLQRDQGFVADIGHLTVFGTCRGCSAANDVKEPSA